MEVSILSNAPEALKRETNEERRGFIQHIINTDDPRRERKELLVFLNNDSNKERYPDEYEEKQKLWQETFKKLKEISANYLAIYPQDVLKAYKKLSKAFDAKLREVWYSEVEHETSGTKEINLEDTYLSNEGIGNAELGYYNPNFDINDETFYIFPMFAVVCKKDVSQFNLVNIEEVSVTYEYQEFKEKKRLVGSFETSRHLYPCDYRVEEEFSLYGKDIIRSNLYGILTIQPFDITLYVSNISKGAKIVKAFNEYIDFIKSKKGLVSEETLEKDTKQCRNDDIGQIVTVHDSDSFSDFNETIEVSYTVLGYDRLGETTFDMDVKEKEYEWLSEKEGEGEYLDSDFISENRRGLHKRILKAIRNNMKDEACDPDDGMVEYVSSAIHRRDFFEDASYDYASDFADDDDIEYTITL